ncbi:MULTISPECIES: OprD family porin [Pseudomonas]|uniref:OprD family porin n=1 Tax=Pseudomonas TaxID=286 RepID=UPI0030DB33C6
MVTVAAEADTEGFIEGGHLKLLARNLYWSHDGHGGSPDRREWGQGFQLDYTSGYTPGTFGFGVDLSGYQVFKLYGNDRYSGTAGVLVPEDDGTAEASGSVGGAVKVKVSQTQLKYGNNLRPYNPVFAPADTRLLPATATGFWLTSREVADLMVEAGHMTAAKDFNSTNASDDFFASYAGVGADTVDFAGASYAATDKLTVSFYGSDYRDIWRQYYGGLTYVQPLSESRSVGVDLNLYKTDDTGSALAGPIDTTAWSLALTYAQGAHSFKFSYQKNHGDTPFDYLGMGPGTYHDSIYLANSSQLMDFNGPNERSWGAFYNLDMASFGVPGLSFGMRYIKGTDVDGSRMPSSSPYAYYGSEGSEEHWERDVDLRYVVQSGSLQGLSLRLRQATHRIGNQASAKSSDQVRLIVQYPYDFF